VALNIIIYTFYPLDLRPCCHNPRSGHWPALCTGHCVALVSWYHCSSLQLCRHRRFMLFCVCWSI